MLQSIVSFITRPKQPDTTTNNGSMWKWISDRFRWRPTSVEQLEHYEQHILRSIKKPYSLKMVDVPGFGKGGKPCRIRTLSIQDGKHRNDVPLVLLHGLGAGIGLWVLNVDDLAEQGPVHAIDLPGFGMSSRLDFGKSAPEVEEQFVDTIENWRKEMHLNKFILLGHSMGGYLASAYAMKYPDNVSHVILADPWGFADRSTHVPQFKLVFWARAMLYVSQFFNPFAPLRLAGPLGPELIPRFRPDILMKFSPVADHQIVSNYLYHCNAQKPTGETAFKTLSDGIGWAKLPMVNRVGSIPEDVPFTFIYGSRSWISSDPGYDIKKTRPNVEIKIINGAGHHIYADKYNVFNSYVLEVCREINDFSYDIIDKEQLQDYASIQ